MYRVDHLQGDIEQLCLRWTLLAFHANLLRYRGSCVEAVQFYSRIDGHVSVL